MQFMSYIIILLMFQNIFHGAISLDQLYFARPTSGLVSSNCPVSGLYLCGSGAHPGDFIIFFMILICE